MFQPPPPPDQNVPDFAKRPFETFSSVNAVAIALREWRAFGSLVDNEPPDGRQDLPYEQRPDKQPGLWQRVGEYWWLSQDAGTREASWTSKYSASGAIYQADAPAWSAAFISYVMRSAGAATRFPYSPLHSEYINGSVRGGYALQGYAPGTVAPQPGDLVCSGRGAARVMRFENLPAGSFLSHCDLVVEVVPGRLSVVGGNVDAAVTLRNIPMLEGGVPDPRWHIFVVIRVQYDQS